MFHFIFYSLTAQEVDELRLGRERQARKRKAATEKKQAEAKAAEEAAKVKELEEKAWRAREEKQREELLAQNKALSDRLLAMCPTSTPTKPVQPVQPVQPVYAPQTVSSPHTSLSLPSPLPTPQQGHAGNILQMLQGFMSSFAPPPAPPQTVVQDLSIVPLGVTPNMETPVGTEIAVLQAGPPVGIGTPLTTRMPTSAGAPASVTSETIASGPTNEEMRAPTLVTRQKRPSAAWRIWKTTPRDGEGTADTSSDSSSESGAESTSDGGYERMSTDSPQISPPRTPRRRRCGAARMTSKTLNPNRTVRRKGKYIAFCPYTCQCWLCYQSLLNFRTNCFV